MRFALHRLGIATACCALAIAGALIAGRLGGLLGGGLGGGFALWVWLILPRTAHAAFESGNYAVASRRYRLLEALAGSERRARASLLSRAACRVALGDGVAAEALLAGLDVHALEAAERTVLLNNRACARLAGGDPLAALAFVDEAAALRPDVPSVQHTRGRALLEVRPGRRRDRGARSHARRWRAAAAARGRALPRSREGVGAKRPGRVCRRLSPAR